MFSLKAVIKTLEQDHTEFLKQCKIENYQASGPGGQKRNRKLSAVRLTFFKNNISVTASEFRETHRNLSSAVSKLRLELAMDKDISLSDKNLLLLDSINFQIDISEVNHTFSLSVLKAVFYFRICSASIRETSERLLISSSKLIKFFKKNKQVWKKIQEIRKEFNHTPLK